MTSYVFKQPIEIEEIKAIPASSGLIVNPRTASIRLRGMVNGEILVSVKDDEISFVGSGQKSITDAIAIRISETFKSTFVSIPA